MKNSPAFSLLELLIVILIIAILIGIGLTRYSNVTELARSAEAYAVLSQIVAAEGRYYQEYDSYTVNFTDLDIFTSDPTSDNFTFSVPSNDASTGYASAERKTSSGGRLSYGMCLNNGKQASCDIDSCDPVCP